MAFETSNWLAQDHVAAIVEAEILTDPVRAERYVDLLARGLVPPQLVSCLDPPEPGRTCGSVTPLWLIFEEPDPWGDRRFIVFDHNHRTFCLGFLGRGGQRAL